MQTAVVAPAVAVSSKSASLQWCHLSRLNLYVTLRKKLVTLTCAEGNCNVNVLNWWGWETYFVGVTGFF